MKNTWKITLLRTAVLVLGVQTGLLLFRFLVAPGLNGAGWILAGVLAITLAAHQGAELEAEEQQHSFVGFVFDGEDSQ